MVSFAKLITLVKHIDWIYHESMIVKQCQSHRRINNHNWTYIRIPRFIEHILHLEHRIMVVSQTDGNTSYSIDVDLNPIDGTIHKQCGSQQCHVYHPPAITIFIGRMNKPSQSWQSWVVPMTFIYPHQPDGLATEQLQKN